MSTSIRWCEIDELDQGTLDAWTELGTHARDPSPYLMPQFILPAARWLTPGRPPCVALFERSGRSGRELVGVGCFTVGRPNLFVPVPHLRNYCTRHSFRTGLLVAPAEAGRVAQALLRASRDGAGAAPSHAIAFKNVLERDEVFAELRDAAGEGGGSWREVRRFARPVLRLQDGTDASGALPRKTLKDLRRHRRRLHECGHLSARVLQANEMLHGATERHLELEHCGWKGERGSAMLCSTAGAMFFRDMVERFGRIGAAVFLETLVGDRVIGSTSNFLVGGTLSAFKIGWHPDFARHSPGRLTKLALFEAIAGTWPHVDKYDSNSQQNCFLAKMLPHTETIVSGFLATSRWGTNALRAVRLIRPFVFRLGGDPWTEQPTREAVEQGRQVHLPGIVKGS